MTVRVLDIALRADGLLATFAEAGVLGLADVNTAVRLARLAGEEDDTVRLALALAVRALRNGSVCLELATAHELPALDETGEPVHLPWPEPTAWLAAVAASPLVGVGGGAAARALGLHGAGPEPGRCRGRPPAAGSPSWPPTCAGGGRADHASMPSGWRPPSTCSSTEQASLRANPTCSAPPPKPPPPTG